MTTPDMLTAAWNVPGFKWNREKAAHLLNRTGFCAPPEAVEALLRLSPQAAVAKVVDYEAEPAYVYPLEFDAYSHPVFGSPRRRRAFFQRFTPAERRKTLTRFFQASFEKMQEMRFWWLHRMIHTPRPLEEKLTLFWHGLFVSGFDMVHNAYHMYMQNNLFRTHAAGNIKTLTWQMAIDPAMLAYLNNNQNRKAHPNENFARELMELFTMGIGNYTEEDVRQSARAWTGWTFFDDRAVFLARQHDFGEKTFLGRTGRFNGRDILDIIFEQPATPKHFATKLAIYFGNDEPPPQVISGLADCLKQNAWELKPTLKTLFSSQWFYSDAVVNNKVKSPAELIAGTLKLLGTSAPNPGEFLLSMELMGQMLFEAPNVGGWPTGKEWIDTGTLMARYNMPALLVTGRYAARMPPRLRRILGEKCLREFESPINPCAELAARQIANTRDAVDFYLSRLIPHGIPADRRLDLIRFLNRNGSANARPLSAVGEEKFMLLSMLHLMLAEARYQLC